MRHGWIWLWLGCAAVLQAAPAADTVAHDLAEVHVRSAWLLAFTVQEEPHRLVEEEALAAFEFDNGRYKLVHVYRHPKAGSTWQLKVEYGIPVSTAADFDTRPSPSQVEIFLQDSWWPFKANPGCKLLQGEVYTDAWQAALGYTPHHQYPAPDRIESKK
ncbi:MAG TPA: hypothetical protein VGO93_15500 [Candidatus Xenobia bacterium]|jgi:hypothetical protein